MLEIPPGEEMTAKPQENKPEKFELFSTTGDRCIQSGISGAANDRK
jgi:hypothetical protein